MSDPLASTTLSYAAYAEIPADGQRWEFLDGEVFVTPAPSPAHQFAVLRLGRFLEDNLAAFGDDAIAFVSPIDVILNAAEIVQPDAVVAHRSQVSSRGIEGAPTLLVEVVSPTRPSLDREIKARRYAANGVAHFWLVDPVARTMECFELGEGRYALTAAVSGQERVALAHPPGLSLDLARLWMP
ncbi:MAG: Uma2 family endonuclease [Vicinamibacteraceae bacterium]